MGCAGDVLLNGEASLLCTSCLVTTSTTTAATTVARLLFFILSKRLLLLLLPPPLLLLQPPGLMLLFLLLIRSRSWPLFGILTDPFSRYSGQPAKQWPILQIPSKKVRAHTRGPWETHGVEACWCSRNHTPGNLDMSVLVPVSVHKYAQT